jgi:hypothetical protein
VKTALVALFVLLALSLGGMAAAWRRACVFIAKSATLAFVRRISQEEIIRFTPRFVSMRHFTALGFLALATLFSLAFFRWYTAIAVFVGTWLGMEALGFVFLRPSHPYYLWQIRSDFTSQRDMFRRFNDEPHAAEMQTRLEMLDSAFGKQDAS